MSSGSEPPSTAAAVGLPPLRRVITTHDADGKAVFSEELSQTIPRIEIPGMHFHLGYTLNQSPGVLNNDQDLKEYKDRLPHNVAASIPGGTVLRIVDFLPGEGAPMHRTKTVDFGVILEGELELILDSGESTVLRRGDILVQRGTIHEWKNNSTTEIARGFFVLVDAALPTVNGTQLREEISVDELKTE
ncbi:uncharacterized protein TRIVIDRAFT_35539 [Trichoderma virens Gv29-8]|uniref:Cupin type-2 domain-containing protein n=1 Tax=Hypocrea virens (strain Gv29-8 / FGSC 10586) TaxID=413071 RepID=G9MHS0_HYPVG|nr:uncharacterized protein TRIVIDRAFT_35539 [Trichoderma virens Gv29-8]EHK26258.1 hypothetical protein TRIVIDRAFT_35539 [Trichoderma virens Gv29-8]UKZ46444.1 hypothetical protein TrVGV298_000647 [Trichoderma virens]